MDSSPTRTTIQRSGPRGLRAPQGYTWILPAFLISVGLLYYSIGYTGYISTLDWDGSSPSPTSVGLGNFTKMINDPVVWQALAHTLSFYVVTFVAQALLGLVFATMQKAAAGLG